MRGVSQSNLRASSLQLYDPGYYSRVHHLYHVSIIFCIVSISCCWQHLCNPAKEIRLFFMNTKVIAQQNKTSNKTSDASEKANNTLFQPSIPCLVDLSFPLLRWKLMGQVDLCRPFAVVYQSFTSRPHTTQGTIFVIRCTGP